MQRAAKQVYNDNGAHTPYYSLLSDSNIVSLPGFIDVHVHLREPGFSYKETVASGTLAAAAGGYTAVCCMPNLRPVTDSVGSLAALFEIIERDAHVRVYPYASITVGEMGEQLTDFAALKMAGAIALSDDGKGIQSEEMMLAAMRLAKENGLMIVAHCEDNSLLRGGYINDGEYARAHGHAGICSKSEWGQIERDLRLAEITGAKYHVCHISTAESVQLIREAKARGVDISCETAPHYLLLDDSMLGEDGRFKMNPPIRSARDREALIEGIKDGTVDMIATDHAPHSAEEKSKGLAGSLMGVVGLETAFPALYTGLVRTGIITLEKLTELMSKNPSERFGIPVEGECIWDLNAKYTVDPKNFRSKGRATPFEGMQVYGKCLKTTINGRTVWDCTTEN